MLDSELEVEIYGQDHKLSLLPNFTKQYLQDDEDISDAFERVVMARKKIMTKTEKLNILDKIKHWLSTDGGPNQEENEYTVGQLRKQDRERWRELKIPLMAREYLRNLVVQAQDLNDKQILECQFNRGRSIDWTALNEKVEMISAMGFDRKHATEAMIVNNLNQNATIEMLLTLTENKEDKQREWQYLKNREMKRRNMCVTYNNHHSVLKLAIERGEQKKEWLKLRMSELRRKISESRKELKALKTSRKEKEVELRTVNYKTELARFGAFLKGLTDSGFINAEEMQKVTQMKQRFKDEEVISLIVSHGMTMEEFEDLKQFEDDNAEDFEDECAICLDNPKEIMFKPCGHVALCEECFEDNEFTSCFMCRKEFTDVIKVIKG